VKHQFGNKLILLLILLPACTGAPEVMSVLTYQNCEQLSAGVKSIDYAEIAGIRGSVMLDYKNDEAPLRSEALKFLALSKGVQPTSGYTLSLGNNARIVDDKLEIPVIWQTPLPDTLQAQMLTHPCLIVALDWPQEMQNKMNITFVDQNGELIATYPESTLQSPVSASY